MARGAARTESRIPQQHGIDRRAERHKPRSDALPAALADVERSGGIQNHRSIARAVKHEDHSADSSPSARILDVDLRDEKRAVGRLWEACVRPRDCARYVRRRVKGPRGDRHKRGAFDPHVPIDPITLIRPKLRLSAIDEYCHDILGAVSKRLGSIVYIHDDRSVALLVVGDERSIHKEIGRAVNAVELQPNQMPFEIRGHGEMLSIPCSVPREGTVVWI